MNNNEKLPSSSIAKIVSQSSDSYLLNLTIEDKKIRFWSFDIDILNDKSCFDHPDYQIFIKYVDYPFNLLAKSTIAFIEKHCDKSFYMNRTCPNVIDAIYNETENKCNGKLTITTNYEKKYERKYFNKIIKKYQLHFKNNKNESLKEIKEISFQYKICCLNHSIESIKRVFFLLLIIFTILIVLNILFFIFKRKKINETTVSHI